ncbi:transcription elongation factor GreB [Stenotrophobium rhamnosiphilum]|uniref:Transcription elongation factor GreB n=1 Tax=Stenotrophobium rhamnosiphilum TaxID=2029166 RepID=A0A2T5MI04_9GAMM|nr:transcription elongation factor GreB [Stenotrophobium rhamnosiphilum]PTU32223.1 transcription elongation factor GreB [Stenotrophobium rhamnosiphilum]
MSRYRPPQAKSSPYITAEGQARLKGEFDELWRVRRPEVVRALSAAAAEGDRSENAEYIYRKKELREIDARLKYLTLRLEEVKVVDRAPGDLKRVFFAAWVEVADDNDDRKTYRIVGSDEVDTSKGWISVDSPVARALLGKTKGDVVQVALPGGESELELVAIRYD